MLPRALINERLTNNERKHFINENESKKQECYLREKVTNNKDGVST